MEGEIRLLGETCRVGRSELVSDVLETPEVYAFRDVVEQGSVRKVAGGMSIVVYLFFGKMRHNRVFKLRDPRRRTLMKGPCPSI